MKNFFKNFVLTASSILIIFILLEMFLYFEDKSPDYKRYKLKLSDINLKFNDDPETFLNSKNKNNAIFLGDSFTVNEVCAAEKQDFVNLVKKSNKSGYTFYNFGSLGITSTDMVNIYNYLKKGNISKLIIVLYYNDIFLSQQSCKNLLKFDKYGIPYVEKCNKILKNNQDTSNNSTLKKIDNYLEWKIKTWRLLKEALANTPLVAKFYNRTSWKHLYQNKNSDEFRLLLNVLEYFKKESEIENFQIIFTYFPDVNNIVEENKLHNDWINFINEAQKKY